MTPHDLDKLISKYLQGKCNDEEKAFIDRWYSSLGTADARGEKEVLNEFDTTSVGSRILGKIRNHAVAEPEEMRDNNNRSSVLWPVTAIAASLLFLMAVGYMIYLRQSYEQNILARDGESSYLFLAENEGPLAKRVILPDGSLIELSSKSKIRFINKPGSSTRELFLEGEAWFDVAHDHERPFFVYAGDVVTKVLGTSFNVKAFNGNNQITVTVKTGKVSVYSKNAEHKKIVLTPNQEAVYNRTTSMVDAHTVSDAKISTLRSPVKEVSFEETPVSDVLAGMEKDFAVDIEFDEEALAGCVLTSTFMEEGFYDRMDIICTAIGATYDVVDGQIIIASNGCKINPNPNNQ